MKIPKCYLILINIIVFSMFVGLNENLTAMGNTNYTPAPPHVIDPASLEINEDLRLEHSTISAVAICNSSIVYIYDCTITNLVVYNSSWVILEECTISGELSLYNDAKMQDFYSTIATLRLKGSNHVELSFSTITNLYVDSKASGCSLSSYLTTITSITDQTIETTNYILSNTTVTTFTCRNKNALINLKSSKITSLLYYIRLTSGRITLNGTTAHSVVGGGQYTTNYIADKNCTITNYIPGLVQVMGGELRVKSCTLGSTYIEIFNTASIDVDTSTISNVGVYNASFSYWQSSTVYTLKLGEESRTFMFSTTIRAVTMRGSSSLLGETITQTTTTSYIAKLYDSATATFKTNSNLHHIEAYNHTQVFVTDSSLDHLNLSHYASSTLDEATMHDVIYMYNFTILTSIKTTIYYIYSYDSSQIYVQKGLYRQIKVYDNSTLEILHARWTTNGYLYGYDIAHMTIQNVTAVDIYGYNSATLTIHNVTTTYIYGYNTATITVTNTTASSITMRNSAQVTVSKSKPGIVYTYDTAHADLQFVSTTFVRGYNGSSITGLNVTVSNAIGMHFVLTGNVKVNATNIYGVKGVDWHWTVVIQNLTLSGTNDTLHTYWLQNSANVVFDHYTTGNAAVSLHDTAQLKIIDGTIRYLYLYNSSKVTCNDTVAFTNYPIRCYDHSTFLANDSNLQDLHLYGYATATLTYVNDVRAIYGYDNSSCSIYQTVVGATLNFDGNSHFEYDTSTSPTLDYTEILFNDMSTGLFKHSAFGGLSTYDFSTAILDNCTATAILERLSITGNGYVNDTIRTGAVQSSITRINSSNATTAYISEILISGGTVLLENMTDLNSFMTYVELSGSSQVTFDNVAWGSSGLDLLVCDTSTLTCEDAQIDSSMCIIMNNAKIQANASSFGNVLLIENGYFNLTYGKFYDDLYTFNQTSGYFFQSTLQNVYLSGTSVLTIDNCSSSSTYALMEDSTLNLLYGSITTIDLFDISLLNLNTATVDTMVLTDDSHAILSHASVSTCAVNLFATITATDSTITQYFDYCCVTGELEVFGTTVFGEDASHSYPGTFTNTNIGTSTTSGYYILKQNNEATFHVTMLSVTCDYVIIGMIRTIVTPEKPVAPDNTLVLLALGTVGVAAVGGGGYFVAKKRGVIGAGAAKKPK